eukprot:gene9310-10292_t
MIRKVVIASTTGNPPSPRSFHASTAIGNSIYIHGGINISNQVFSDLYKYDIPCKTWSKIETLVVGPSCRGTRPGETLPFLTEGKCSERGLSHHSAVIFKQRYIVLIGGWNGKKRTSEVFFFDKLSCHWYKAKNSGDVPVGLSSHTSNLVSENEAIIIGREGGIHTQRRNGNAFLLNLSTGNYKALGYHVDSRSGHTANFIKHGTEKGYRLFIYSGRKTEDQHAIIGRWDTIIKDYKITTDLADNLVGFSMDIGYDGKCYIFGGRNGKHCNNQLWNLEVSKD